MLEKVFAVLVEAFKTDTASMLAFALSAVTFTYTAFSSKRLEKQKAELQKQIDRANVMNDRLTHIQNNQYDYKFKVCQDLSETSFAMCHHFCVYVQCALLGGPEDKAREEQYMISAERGCYNYRDMVFKYAAFIPKDLYDKFNDLLVQGVSLLRLIATNRLGKVKVDISEINNDCQMLMDVHQKLTEDLRAYLEKLARGEENA